VRWELFLSEIPRCYTFSNKGESGGRMGATNHKWKKSIPASLYFLSVELFIKTQQ
jgi:hypothetical protein